MSEYDWHIVDGEIVTAGGHHFDCVETTIGGNRIVAYNTWFIRDILPIWEANGLVDRLAGNVNMYLEIGVNCGVSFAWVIENLLHGDGAAIGIDPYEHVRSRNDIGLKIGRELCESNLQPWKDRFMLINEPSQLALSRYIFSLFSSVHRKEDPITPSFDFVYIDGDHYGPRAFFDMAAAFELMPDGGIIVIDDYNRQFSHGAKQVRPAVNAFFDLYSNMIEPLFIIQQQAAFVKRSSRGDRKRRRRARKAAMEGNE